MLPANYFRFTHEEAVRDGRSPWQLQTDFDAEVNLDDMAATGNAFIRAAEQSHEAEDLAARATQTSQQSGGIDGRAMVDGEGRLTETNTALPTTESEEAVDYIFRAMNAARRTEEEARRLIEGPGELNVRHEQNQVNAEKEWQDWRMALLNAFNEQHAGLPPELRPTELVVSHNGETEYAVLGAGNIWDLPPSRAEKIRTTHLNVAADDAGRTHDTINGAITTYRKELSEIGGELGTLGYDALEGPLGVFTTPQMAQFAADQLDLELAEPGLPPDPHRVDLYTQLLAQIKENAYADPANPRLENGERDYLNAFYNAVDPETLGKLGGLGYAADPHGRADAQRATVADTINMLMNPDIGGIGPKDAPASIRPFVYDYENAGLIPASNLGGVFDGSLNEAWQRHNGFGDLMSAATVQSGNEFSKDLARAAVDIENQSQTPLFEGYTGPRNTGSSGMLHAASLNTLASAQVLNEEGFRHSLLNQSWDRGAGAGELIHSGTTPPSADPTQVPRDYVEAAYNVLTDAPDYQSAILAPVSDNAAVQGAIGDTALEYMDLISRSGTQGEPAGALDWLIGPEQVNESGMWPAGAEMTIHGNRLTEGFDMSREEREGLFTLLNQADAGVRQDFFHGVAQWEAGTAYNAFEREGTLAPGQPPGETDTFRHIGTIAGTVAQVQGPGAVADLGNARVSGLGAVAASAAFVTGVLDSPGRVAGPVGLGAFGLGEALRHTIPDPQTVADEAQWDALERGDIPVRSAVADAAFAADYNRVREIPDLQRPDGTTVPYTSANWSDFADRSSGAYGHYSTTLENAFNEAMGT